MKHEIVITLEHFDDTENPFDHDGAWRFVSFERSSGNDPDAKEYHTIGFRRKLKAGTAFILDCYEHSGVSWSLAGTGYDCMFDTAYGSGLLISDYPANMGAKTYAERKTDAQNALEVYNAWANGSCLWFSIDATIDDEAEVNLDSCGGFILTYSERDYVFNDYLKPAIEQYISEHVNDGDSVEITLTGDMRDAFDRMDFEQFEREGSEEPEFTA